MRFFVRLSFIVFFFCWTFQLIPVKKNDFLFILKRFSLGKLPTHEVVFFARSFLFLRLNFKIFIQNIFFLFDCSDKLIPHGISSSDYFGFVLNICLSSDEFLNILHRIRRLKVKDKHLTIIRSWLHKPQGVGSSAVTLSRWSRPCYMM